MARSHLVRICASFALAMAACDRPAPPAPVRPPAKVVVAQPVKQWIVEWDEYVGRLEAVDFVEVRAQVGGALASTFVDEGRIVAAGTVLALIDPRPFRADLDRAKAAVAQADAQAAKSVADVGEAQAMERVLQARLNLANLRAVRARALLQSNVGTREENETAEAELSQAQANLEAGKARTAAARSGESAAAASREAAVAAVHSAQLSLSYTTVTAPISGRLGRALVKAGNLISGGSAESTLLTTIVSLDPIHAYFDADEAAFLRYARLAQAGKRPSSRDVRNPVYMALADETGFSHHGHMDFVENRFDPGTDTIRGRAVFHNPGNILTPGMFVRLRLPATPRYEAVLIPDRAVVTDQADKLVYVIDEGETVRRQSIELGALSHGLRIVHRGLTGSERIVISGLQRVRAGDHVTATAGAIAAIDTGLPDEYVPVPESEWIIGRKPQPTEQELEGRDPKVPQPR